jgi:probable F420-dependent oxidoreductase
MALLGLGTSMRETGRLAGATLSRMKLGLRLPQRAGVDLRGDVIEVARTAEAAGFASLWTFERLLFPVEPKEPYPGDPDRGWPESMRQTADPLAVLTAAAVVTEAVRLGTSVLVAALHTPIQLAKSLATIDQISGGRVIAGIGVGWSSDELQAAGVTRADRGRLIEETLDVFEAVWGPDPVSYRGSRTVIEDAYVLPKPVSHIPVMIGGGAGRKTLERIATRSDGWLSMGATGADANLETWQRILELAAEHGREGDRIEHVVCGNVTFTERRADEDRPAFTGSLDQIVDDIAAAAATGADELVIDLNLQDWFTDTRRLLETAVELRERAIAAGI